MKWTQVQANWSAFYEAMADKWPDIDESRLDEIDGDQRSFITYVAELIGGEPEDARAEIREWLAGEIPSDIVMDPSHDDRSMKLSAKFVGEGEDEYDDDARFGDDGKYPDDGD